MDDGSRPGFAAALKQEVDSICDPIFARAVSQAEFLRLLCDQTLHGERGGLSQYALAVDGMGKPDTFDPILQSNVRVRASRLRASLEGHYRLMQPIGGLCVYLRKGSYQLRLAPANKAYPQTQDAVQPLASILINSSSQRDQLARLRWFGFGSLVTLALAATGWSIMHLPLLWQIVIFLD
jgi:hypothetical protein